ncbi:phospholipase D-like domain-containing protein [Massilia sp. CCM 9210]|nr:phospholipase D-like domain-containing protein [Massilia sp. CCM 9210]
MQATGEVLHGEIYLPALTPAGTHSARVFTSFSASYFVPDTVAVNSLIAAVARGVKVRIIVPEKYQDWEVVRRASRTAWGRLLQGGVELYEYQPSFDARSFSINDEANLNICDAGFAERQAAIFRSDLERSRRITFAEWEARPWSDKALDFGASLLASQLQSSRCRLQFRLASTISTQCRRAGFATSWPRRCRSPAA